MSEEITYSDYRPGALAAVVRMHMAYYSTNWGFGLAFETKVASELAEFLSRYQEGADLFLAAYRADGECVGSISLDHKDAANRGAHIRWFIVDTESSARGIGRALLNKAIVHCDRCGFDKIYLTTFEGLDLARKLYESTGFELTETYETDQWSGGVKEQLFVRQSQNI